LTEYLISRSEHIVSNSSVTVLKGSTALSVIDRTVSTKLTEMKHFDTMKTMFCDANGRVEDFARVYLLDEQLLMINSSQYGTEIRKKLIDGIGWDEECTLLNGDDAISHVSVICPDSNDIKSNFGLENELLTNGKVLECGDLIFSNTEFDYFDMIDILAPRGKLTSVLQKLNESGSMNASEDRWDFLRISLGIPSIDDARGNLPNELGLTDLVSLDKGCYPGQEIHARIDSRGRTTKNLVRIVSKFPILLGIHEVDGIGKIRVSSTQTESGVSLSLGICSTIKQPVSEITLEDGQTAIIEQLIFP